MTKEQAYAALGWTPEGKLDSFILPATGEPGNYRPFVCECGWQMIVVDLGPFDDGTPIDTCGGCGAAMKEILESGRDGNGPAC